jgi:hypothetical protein
MLEVKPMIAPTAKKALSSNIGKGRGLVIVRLPIAKGESDG